MVQPTLPPAANPSPAPAAGGVPAPAPFVLLCKWCGRNAPLTGADLSRYIGEGWPHCCNFPMSCSTPDAEKCGRHQEPPGRPHSAGRLLAFAWPAS